MFLLERVKYNNGPEVLAPHRVIYTLGLGNQPWGRAGHCYVVLSSHAQIIGMSFSSCVFSARSAGRTVVPGLAPEAKPRAVLPTLIPEKRRPSSILTCTCAQVVVRHSIRGGCPPPAPARISWSWGLTARRRLGVDVHRQESSNSSHLCHSRSTTHILVAVR